MPEPVMLERPEGRSRFLHNLIGLVLTMPPLAMLLLWWQGHPIPTRDSGLAFDCKVLAVLSAALLAFKMSRQRFTIAKSSGQIVLPRQSFAWTLLSEWWTMVVMWPAAVLGVAALYQEAERMQRWGVHPPIFTGSLLLSWWLAFVLCNYYFSIMSASPVGWRVLDDGVGTGLTFFIEWENVHHVTDAGGMLYFFHQRNPWLPFACIRASKEVRETLEPLLSKHGIAVDRRLPLRFRLVQLGALAVAAGVTVDGWWALHYSGLDPRAVILIVAMVDLFANGILERLRGIPDITRTNPIFIDRKATDKPEDEDSATDGVAYLAKIYRKEPGR